MVRPIGVFDSGVGGLNVLKHCAKLLPEESFIYLADKANMPYGNKPKEEIARAAYACADTLFSLNCKAIVIACNTATVTAAEQIRSLYSTRVVVGLEPAVRPCIKELGRRGYAVALVTSATFSSERFRMLLENDKRIVPIAAPELAMMIESSKDDIPRLNQYLSGIFRDYSDAEAVILGCSHYSYIADIIRDIYGGNIKIYDGAEGAARRLKYCLEISGLAAQKGETKPTIRFLSTYKKMQNAESRMQN
ncbi:MAG: glutamate racemase [Clostridiales bacterium]|nr:glutamate racemase [Clostridiales bacterium]